MKSSTEYLLLTILLIAWGLNYPAVKFGLQYSAPLAFSFYRVLIAGIVAIPLMLRSIRSGQRTKSFRNKTALIATALFSISATALFLAFWFIGETVVQSGITSVILYTYPLFAVLFTRIFLKDKLTVIKIFGIILGFVGAFLILTGGNISNFSVNPYGFTLLLIAAISFAFSFVIYRKWLIGYNRMMLNTLQLFISAPILFVWAIAINMKSLYTIQFTAPGFLIPLLYSSILGTTFAYIFWMILIENRGTVWLSGWLFFVPVIALVSSNILLGEQIGSIQLIGFVVTLVGIGGVTRG